MHRPPALFLKQAEAGKPSDELIRLFFPAKIHIETTTKRPLLCRSRAVSIFFMKCFGLRHVAIPLCHCQYLAKRIVQLRIQVRQLDNWISFYMQGILNDQVQHLLL